MNALLEAIVNRDKGPYVNVSIGTALAIEGAFGYDTPEGQPRLKPNETPPIYQYDAVWINVHTLIRNFLGSFDREVMERASIEELASGIMEDMSVIEGVIRNFTRTRVRCVWYLSHYRGIARKFPHAKLKQVKTPLQKLRAGIQDALVKHLLEDHGSEDLRVFDFDIMGQDDKALMVTHYPVDLLSRRHFAKLDLLESHTGKIKRQSQWGSKLTGKHTDQLPFNALTLQLYGDGDMFLSQPQAFKEEIERLAQQDRWSPVTTYDKIKNSINTHIYDPRVKAHFLALLSR